MYPALKRPRLDAEWVAFREKFMQTHFTAQGYSGNNADEGVHLSSFLQHSPPAETEAEAKANADADADAVDIEEGDEEDEPAAAASSPLLFPSLNTRTGNEDTLLLSIKSNVLKLNIAQVPFVDLFWRAPVMPYMCAQEGIVRKEVMFHLSSAEKAQAYFAQRDAYVEQNPQQLVTERSLPLKSSASLLSSLAFAPFHREQKQYRGPQDCRSLHVGICQKEIGCKKREDRKAFPNCFVFYLRWSRDGGKTFEESHVKIFSTGKIDMPGLHCPQQLEHVKSLISRLVFQQTDSRLLWEDVSGPQVVLVNSEFQCNFTIHTAKLRDLLWSRYGIRAELKNETPGLKCALFVRRDKDIDHDNDNDVDDKLTYQLDASDEFASARSLHTSKKYFKVTYTFFQSGEVLVSGACPETVILQTFRFIRTVLLTNWKEIRSFAQRTNSKKAKKLQYVSKCKYKVSYAYLLNTILDTSADWRT